MSLVSFIIPSGSAFSDGMGIGISSEQKALLPPTIISGAVNIVATVTNIGGSPFTVTIKSPTGLQYKWGYWQIGYSIGSSNSNYDMGSGWGNSLHNITTGALFEFNVVSVFWTNLVNTSEELS